MDLTSQRLNSNAKLKQTQTLLLIIYLICTPSRDLCVTEYDTLFVSDTTHKAERKRLAKKKKTYPEQ